VDGQGEQLDAEVVGQLAGVPEAGRRGVLGRHGHAVDAVAAERVGGDGRHQAGIDPAGERDQHPLEAVLADVVPGGDDQRAVDLLLGALRARQPGRHRRARVVQLAAGPHLPDLEARVRLGRRGAARTVGQAGGGALLDHQVDQQQLLLEGGGARPQAALWVQVDALPLEHQLVLAADLVHVQQVDPVVGRAGGQHGDQPLGPAHPVRRAVDAHHHVGAGRGRGRQRAPKVASSTCLPGTK
jgi:hypothetical protein